MIIKSIELNIAKLIYNYNSVRPDPQKAASVQAMLADFFGQNCGHFLSKERISISWSQPHELFNFG